MILLITASLRAEECATAIEQRTHQKVRIAGSLNQTIGLLQAHEYDVLVLDESFQQLEAGAESLVATHAGMAVPIYVNLSATADCRTTGRDEGGGEPAAQ